MTFPIPSNPTAPAVTLPKAAEAGQSERVLASDFETFLKMLTAQARNQDPLEPLDSTEYASQLAQFSMVEQQVQTNEALKTMSGGTGASNMAALAGWVGMEVRAPMPTAFSGQPVTISPTVDSTADAAYLVVADSAGNTVQRQPIPVSSTPLQWAGVKEDGTPLAGGAYEFAVESYRKDELLGTAPVEVYGRIVEAQVKGGEVVLVTEGGQTVPSTSVTALREAS